MLTSLPKRIVLGRPISSSRMDETTLPKRLALPAQLRRKLETDSAHPRHLVTEPGLGYRFEV